LSSSPSPAEGDCRIVAVCAVEFAVVLSDPKAESIDEKFPENEATDDSEEVVFTSGESVTIVPGVLVVVLDGAVTVEEPDVVVLLTILGVGLGDAAFINNVEVVPGVVVGLSACARGNA
jgi:hypothetical protein